MQFNSIRSVPDAVPGAEALPAGGGKPPPGPLGEASKNLLKHIPGEATGFYLISAGAFDNPGPGTLGGLALMSFVILVLIRVLAKASVGIIVTTVIAFLLWMFVIDNGFLAVRFPDVLPDPWGLIVASFYSIVITALASAGKIK